MTEFQNCWRNNGFVINEFPHWIHSTKSLTPSSQLFGRIANIENFETILVIAYGSGNLNLKKKGEVRIELIDLDANTHTYITSLQAFTIKQLSIREILKDSNNSISLLDGGTCRIRSKDIDLNCQIVTISKLTNSVSLQHLWGY